MKIASSTIPNSLKTLYTSEENVSLDTPKMQSNIINNGYSSQGFKDTNNTIGILQTASGAINQILIDSHITLEKLHSIIKEARFLGKPIFHSSQVLRDLNDNLLFDGGRILDMLPEDSRDIFAFKKSLRYEATRIEEALGSMQSPSEDEIPIDKDFLTLNAKLFSNAHNTAGLVSKIDSLLA